MSLTVNLLDEGAILTTVTESELLILEHYRVGQTVAARYLVVGAPWAGAQREATSRGYAWGTMAFEMFVAGYVETLHRLWPDGVYTTGFPLYLIKEPDTQKPGPRMD